MDTAVVVASKHDIDDFTPEFRQAFLAELRQRGIEHEEAGDYAVWVQVAPGKLRHVWYAREQERREGPPTQRSDIGVPAFIGDVNRFANGRFRYLTHGIDDSREQPCIPDMACRELRNEWPRYHIERDATGRVIREGPMPFRNAGERDSYLKLAGMEAHGGGEQPDAPKNEFWDLVRSLPDIPAEFDAVEATGENL